MTPSQALALLLDPTLVLAAQGLTPDPWQRDLLMARAQFVLLNCSRQSGKSTTVAALALHRVLTHPGSLVLLVAPSERQSGELFRKALAATRALSSSPLLAQRARPHDDIMPHVKLNHSELELANRSRIVALPGREDTIRSFSGVNLLILDEAARVPDPLYRAVRPMLAVSQGRLLALSTPFGQRGWFHDEWTGAGPWKRLHIPWSHCPRIHPDFIQEELRALGHAWVDQEYNALFTTLTGLVYPDFPQCILSPDFRFEIGDFRLEQSTNGLQSKIGNQKSAMLQVGGIDFGWRNPFAAVWGHLDDDDVLWITHERYLRETPIADHAAALPRDVVWHADPAGATEIAELRRAGLIVKRGNNDLRQGIALVTERLRTGRLKVAPACIHLIQEARLYRYPDAASAEAPSDLPIDAHNHALAALRYLVAKIPQTRAERGSIPRRLTPTQGAIRNPQSPIRNPQSKITNQKTKMLNFLRRLFRRKSSPTYLPAASSLPSLDAYRRHRAPSPQELLAELKNTAWACSSINAAICAAFPPRLYVRTDRGQSPPPFPTRALNAAETTRLVQAKSAIRNPQSAIEEVLDHPLLTLLRQVNPSLNAFDLWELTQLYLEVHGAAYWLLDLHPLLRLPTRIWILPSHLVTPRRAPDSPRPVDFYEYHGHKLEQFSVERIIHFRVPDPRDPYTAGLSPLRACFEPAALTSEFAALKRALYDHAGLPSAVITPEDAISPDERTRLEQQWIQKFQRGGHGQALVADSPMKISLLSQSLGDLAALADMKAAKEDIANAFHVPLPFLTGDTNLANMQAADHLHKSLAILPRLRRRDDKLNERLVPLYDPSGRLFLAADDPVPDNLEFQLRQETADLRSGVRTINEVRAARGLAPVSWGDQPLATAPRAPQ